MLPKFVKRVHLIKKEANISSDKQGVYQEANKQRVHKGQCADAHNSLDKKKKLRKRLAISVYERITRAKSKKNALIDATCDEVKNTRNGKSIGRGSRRQRVQTDEELCQIDIEVGQHKQDTMIETRITRASQICYFKCRQIKKIQELTACVIFQVEKISWLKLTQTMSHS